MRAKIKIVKVFDRRTGTGQKGPWEAQDFTGKSTTQGTDTRFGIFQKKELYPFIVEGAVIDLEWNDKESDRVDPTGAKIIDHNVSNIYVNDKPTLQPAQPQGGSGKAWGKTPEQLAAERASIESQTAYNGIIKLMEAKIAPVEMATLALAWAKKRLV